MSTVTVANAVTKLLNDGDFSHKFKAKRRAFPREKIEKLDNIVVSVFSGPRTSEQITRGQWQISYTVYVAVQRKLSSKDSEQVGESDELTDFVESLEVSFEAAGNLGDYQFDRYDDSTERLPFGVELLRDTGVFAAVIGLVYTD